jgi:hypothetical protein
MQDFSQLPKEQIDENRILFLSLFTGELVRSAFFKLKEQKEIHEQEEKMTREGLLTELSKPIEFQKPEKMLSSILNRPRIAPLVPVEKTINLHQRAGSIISQPLPENLMKPVPGVGIDLGKLNFLLRDPQVTLIECPGSGRLVFVRKLGQTQSTTISLGEQEIKDIISRFSEKARIPLIGKVFTAIVGSLKIFAVISDFAGSRFIISRQTPYSILD